MWATNLGQKPLGGNCRGKHGFSVLTGLGPKSGSQASTGSSQGAGTEMPTATEQGGQGCKAASRLAGISSEIPPPSHKPGSQMESPSPFLGQVLLRQGGGRRAGSSAARVSQRKPKCGSLRGFDAGDV